MTLSKEAEKIFNHFYCPEYSYFTDPLSMASLCSCWYDFSFVGALTEEPCSLLLTLAVFFCSGFTMDPNPVCPKLYSWKSLTFRSTPSGFPVLALLHIL